MFCPACGNNNVPGSLTCSTCGAAFPASRSTSPPKLSAAAQSNPATVPSAEQTKAEQSNAAPLTAGAALAGIGAFGGPPCFSITARPCKLNAPCKASVIVGSATGTLYVNP
jgi:hypothetical protein